MTGLTYTIFAYVISLAMLWGYAGSLLLSWRSLRRRSTPESNEHLHP